MNISSSSFNIFKRDIVIYFINFITSIIISRRLGVTALGIWSILRLIYAYGEVIGRTRIELAGIYFIGKKKYHRNVDIWSLGVLTFELLQG